MWNPRPTRGGTMADQAARIGAFSPSSVSPRDTSQTMLRAAGRVARSLNEVVITGIGVILPNCDDRETFWRHLRDGESQLAFESYPIDQVAFAVGRVRNFDAKAYLAGVTEAHYTSCHREQLFYLA